MGMVREWAKGLESETVGFTYDCLVTTKAAPAPQGQHTIGHEISALSAIYRRLFRQQLAGETWVQEAGLRPPCFGTMVCIDRLGPVTQKQVSKRLGLDPSDMVHVIDILERAGYVTRRRDADDRRRYALELTDDGRAAMARLRALADRANDELLAPLDAKSRAQFGRLLADLFEHHRQHDDVAGS
jgi:DNA-binding MarR family transcriptional regulator